MPLGGGSSSIENISGVKLYARRTKALGEWLSVWFPVPEDCDDFLFLSCESTPLGQSHRPWYCCPHSVPVTSSAVIPGQVNVSSAATLVSPSPRFPNRCIREWRAVFSARSGAENEGDMNFTLRTKKNTLSAAMIAVLSFAGGSLARATDQPRVAASVNRPRGQLRSE